jgi:hypothetical protein
MQIIPFINCCSAQIIYDFGGTDAAIMGSGRPTDKASLKTSIKKAIDNYPQGILIAITNSQQKIAMESLEEMGFHHTEKISKQIHEDTQLIIWYRSCMPRKK